MFKFFKKQKVLSDIKDLQTTIETLKSQISDLHNEFSLILNAKQNRVKKELEWFEDDKYLMTFNNYEDIDFLEYARFLKKQKKIKYIEENPSLKIKQVHHGGCLSCETTINESIKSCLGCAYFHFDFNKYPDLSKKYNKL